MWEELQQEYQGRIEFFEVDRETDDGRDFVRSHRLPIGQPGFVVFDSTGERTYAALGPFDESGLRELVASSLPEES